MIADYRERLAFDVAGFEQAGTDGGQIQIVVAGMGYKLPGTGRHFAEKRIQPCGIEGSRRQNPECAVGRGETLFGDDSFEDRLESCQKIHFKATDRGCF